MLFLSPTQQESLTNELINNKRNKEEYRINRSAKTLLIKCDIRVKTQLFKIAYAVCCFFIVYSSLYVLTLK